MDEEWSADGAQQAPLQLGVVQLSGMEPQSGEGASVDEFDDGGISDEVFFEVRRCIVKEWFCSHLIFFFFPRVFFSGGGIDGRRN